jgi:hypothetical protein
MLHYALHFAAIICVYLYASGFMVGQRDEFAEAICSSAHDLDAN